MATKLRNTINAGDVERLREAHRILIQLMIGLNPSSAAHAPLYAAIWSARGCIAAWTGEDLSCRSANPPIGHGPAPPGKGTDRADPG